MKRVLVLSRLGLAGVALSVALLTLGVGSAGAVTWLCVPETAGATATSGGTGASASCPAKNTAVDLPGYVASGIDGKPTVQFSGVNVQVVNGEGKTNLVNGEGNLMVGYDENTEKH